jgi:hypothetical protein
MLCMHWPACAVSLRTPAFRARKRDTRSISSDEARADAAMVDAVGAAVLPRSRDPCQVRQKPTAKKK